VAEQAPVERHRCALVPAPYAGLAAFATEHAGREWWVVDEHTGERLVRVRYCPWCGEAR
jgi:hypothetical protein